MRGLAFDLRIPIVEGQPFFCAALNNTLPRFGVDQLCEGANARRDEKLPHTGEFTPTSFGVIHLDVVARRKPEGYYSPCTPTDDELFDLARHPMALTVLLQPQFQISNDRLRGAEALCRWQHPRLGLIGPDSFIQRLEELDVAEAIFLAVVERCLFAQQSLNAVGVVVPIGINASARTLCRPGLVDQFDTMVKESKIPAERFVIELTEAVTEYDFAALASSFNRLRFHGYSIAIDDFGIGIATLDLLADLPFTQVKVDKSFVDHILADTNRSRVCRSIIRLAKELGMDSVAEGVETREQLDVLQSLGCDLGQGYLWAPPEPIDEFLVTARRRSD